MRLVLPKGEAQAQLKRDMQHTPGGKFVMFMQSDKTIIAHLFPYHLTHSQVVDFVYKADPTQAFIGAGYVMPEYAEWNSESCLKHCGRDRPADEEKQQKLLDELESEIVVQM